MISFFVILIIHVHTCSYYQSSCFYLVHITPHAQLLSIPRHLDQVKFDSTPIDTISNLNLQLSTETAAADPALSPTPSPLSSMRLETHPGLAALPTFLPLPPHVSRSEYNPVSGD